MTDVFLSYSRCDAVFVQKLDATLQSVGRSVWLDRRDILPTTKWREEIHAGIEDANAFLCVLSPDYLVSEICQQELLYAIMLKKKLIPLALRPIARENVDHTIAELQWIFFSDEDTFDLSFQQILQTLDTDIEYFKAGQRLLSKALDWERNTQKPDHELRGMDLKNAEDWLIESRGKKFGATSLQEQYIHSSHRTARKRRTRLTVTATVTLIALLLLSLGGVYYRNQELYQAQLAQQSASLAQVRALKVQANLALSQHQFDRALLLGTQAYQLAKQVGNEQEGTESLFSSMQYASHIGAVVRSSNIESPRPGVGSLAISQDGHVLLSSTYLNGPIGDGVATSRHSLQQPVANISPGTSAPYAGITLWNTETKQAHNLFLASLKTSNGVDEADLSSDGTLFAAVPYTVHPQTRDVWLGNAVTGQITHEFDDWNTSSNVVFSPDGKLLAAAHCGNGIGCTQPETIRLWNILTQTSTASFVLPAEDRDDSIHQVLFSPNGRYLAAVGCLARGSYCTRRILLWDLVTRELLGVFPTASPGSERALQFSPDGNFLAIGNSDGTVALWSVHTRVQQHLFSIEKNPGEIRCVAFNKDGKLLAVGSADGTVHVWNVQTGYPATDTLVGHDESVSSLVWSSANQLISGDIQGNIIFWRFDPFDKQTSFSHRLSLYSQTAGEDIEQFVFTPDGRSVIANQRRSSEGSSQETFSLVLLNRQNLATIATFPAPDGLAHTTSTQLAVSPDGHLLAVADDTHVSVWDIARRRYLRTFHLPEGFSRCHLGLNVSYLDIAFRPDGQRLAASCGDGGVLIWDVSTGNPVDALIASNVKESLTHSKVVWSSDGSILATLYTPSDIKSSEVIFWDTRRGKPVGETVDQKQVTDVALVPGGQTFAILTSDGIISSWSIAQQKLARDTFSVNEGSAFYEHMAFRSNSQGGLIAVEGSTHGEYDATTDVVSFWDMKTHRHPFDSLHFSSNLSALEFSPDGNQLAFDLSYGGGPYFVGLDMNPDSWQQRACDIAHRNLTVKEWNDLSTGRQIYQGNTKVCPQFPFDESMIKSTLVQAIQSAHSASGATLFTQAAQRATETDDAIMNWYVCQYGTVYQFTHEVFSSCKRAAQLEPENGFFRDSLGVARAVLGDKAAVQDLLYVVEWSKHTNLSYFSHSDPATVTKEWEQFSQKREQWVQALRAGHQPFSAQVLRSFLSSS